MRLSPRWIAVAVWAIVLVIVPLSCVSCVNTKRDPPTVSVEPIIKIDPATTRTDDEADFLVKVFYKLKDFHYKGYRFNYDDLANVALAAIAEELKVRGVEFIPRKIDSSVYNDETHAIFKEEFHRAEKLSEGMGLVEHELIFLATDAALDSIHETHTYFKYPPGFVGRGRVGGDSGSVYGIGAQIRKYKEEFFYIEKIIPGGAAAKSGLKRFDRITKVNGDSVRTDLNDLISGIRGPENTVLDMTIERAGVEMKFTMVRGKIGELLADAEIIEDGLRRWSYVRFHEFSFTALHVINELNHDPGIFGTTVNGTIIDLRGNPGGYIVVLEMFLEYFLTKGSLSFITDGKEGKDLRVVMTNPIYSGKLVVLVDENSFSGAEIFASAIQTNGRGKIVGAKTTGFVSVGTEISLPYEANMLVMVDKVLDANGIDLEYLGVTPDEVLEITREDILAGRDVQLEKAMEVLKGDKK